MIFKDGYPKVNGASDFEDSSHLAGILAIMEHPEAVDCRKYVYRGNPLGKEWFKYVRCFSPQYDFSRDQAILLIAGLIKQGHGQYVNLAYITGRDILPPSVRGMVRIAQGKKPMCYQIAWLKAEIYFNAYLQPLEEPFQIIALCMTYGDEYLKLWTELNPKWYWAIRRYLSQLDGSWRNEPELAEFVIDKIKARLAS